MYDLMRKQICSTRSFDPDKQKSRIKLPSMVKSGIGDPGLGVREDRPWGGEVQYPFHETLASNRQATSSARYNDNITLLILQYIYIYHL